MSLKQRWQHKKMPNKTEKGTKKSNPYSQPQKNMDTEMHFAAVCGKSTQRQRYLMKFRQIND